MDSFSTPFYSWGGRGAGGPPPTAGGGAGRPLVHHTARSAPAPSEGAEGFYIGSPDQDRLKWQEEREKTHVEKEQ